MQLTALGLQCFLDDPVSPKIRDKAAVSTFIATLPFEPATLLRMECQSTMTPPCIPKRKWISDTEPRLFKTQVSSSVFLPFKYQQSFWSTGWRLYSIHQLWPFSQFALLACCFIDAALAILYDMFLVHFGPNGRGYGCSVKYTVVNYTSRI